MNYDSVASEHFPLILKGVESVGKSLIQVVRAQAELAHNVEKYGLSSVTLEPYFEGIDIDLNLVVKNGKIVWS